ncbi:metal ABC transporter substrate-binding protein, partial [Candidatus Gracilibacteria bacterium]|nr:metal ABC transporter substrate-binding protein [Candidatus Gracilibacteria bacterium]
MKKIALLIVMVLFLTSCNNAQENKGVHTDDNSPKIEVVTSIIPLASIANYIGGDYVDTISLIPAGVSPHGFDLKPNQMIELEKSDLIISLGFDHIDGFLDKVIEGKNVLIASDNITLMEGSDSHDHEYHEDEHHEDEDEDHEDEGHEDDTHVWTSSVNALIIAINITEKLTELSPENKTYFEGNYLKFENELTEIKQGFLDRTTTKTQKEFIVFHDAYNYFFDELSIDSQKKLVFQTNVLSDPNSAEMKELIDEIDIHGVNIAFKEPQFNDK